MENLQNKIFVAARKLFEEYSPKKVSIDMITKEAGIGKGTFYNYFQNKEDVYEQIIDEYLNGEHIQAQKKDILKLKKEKRLLCIFIWVGYMACSDPIIKNFILRNENFCIGKINYDYLEAEHLKNMQNMFSESFENFDAKFLSELLWFYTHWLINKSQELSEKEFEVFTIKTAGVFVWWFISNYEEISSQIDFEKLKQSIYDDCTYIKTI